MNAISIATAATATPAPAAVMFERKPLVDALAFLAKHAVEARNTIPIVSCVLIEATDDGARLTGSDLDLWLSTTIAAAWDVPGAIAVDARELLAAAKAGGDMVTIDADGRVSDGTLSSRIASRDASDFPRPKAFETGSRFALDAATLAHDLARVVPCISSEETRYYLNGVFIHTDNGSNGSPVSFHMATTDGHRLAQITRPVPAFEGDALPDTILPRKAIAAVRAAIGKKPAGTVSFDIRASRFVVEAGAWRLDSKAIDGTFPDYRRCIPSTGNGITMTADGAALARVLRAVTTSNGKKGGAVELTRDGDACRADYAPSDMENGVSRVRLLGTGTIAAEWSDDRTGEPENAWLSFNAAYLAPMADALDGPVTIAAADNDCPARVVTPAAPELIYVLMPVRPARVMLAQKAGTHKPRNRPVAVPVESASDVFDRTYRAAFEANDGPAMAAAVEAYRATDHCQSLGARLHSQIAMAAGNIRYRSRRDASAKPARVARESARVARSAKRDLAILRMAATYRRNGSLAFLRTSEERRLAVAADRAAKLAALAALPGYSADDARDVVPVVTVDGKRRFVRGDMLRNVLFSTADIVKADGTFPRGRFVKRLDRRDIARIVPDRAAAPVVPAPVVDVAPPVAPVERVETVEAETVAPVAVDAPAPVPAPDAVDVAALVATVAALASRVAELEATRVAPAPVPAAPASNDARDALIATLIAERDAIRAERDALATERDHAVAEYAAIQVEGGKAVAALDIARSMTHGLIDARKATAGRMRALRAASRAARDDARQLRSDMARVAAAMKADRAELARLRPVAAAIAALTAAPAAASPLPHGDPFVAHGGVPIADVMLVEA